MTEIEKKIREGEYHEQKKIKPKYHCIENKARKEKTTGKERHRVVQTKVSIEAIKAELV